MSFRIGKFFITINLFIVFLSLIFNFSLVEVEAKSNVSLIDGVIVDIAAGTDHNLALDQQGNLWAWGRNDYGQIGNGTTIDQCTPTQIMRGHKFKKISAGNNISAAIDVDGYLYVWGNKYSVNGSSYIVPTKIDNILYKDVTCGTFVDAIALDENSISNYLGYNYINYRSNIKSTTAPAYENAYQAMLKQINNFRIYQKNSNVINFHNYSTKETRYFYQENGGTGGWDYIAYLPNTISNKELIYSNFRDYDGVSYYSYNVYDVSSYGTSLITQASISCCGFVVDENGDVIYVSIIGEYNDEHKTYTFFNDMDLSSLVNIKDVAVTKKVSNNQNTAFFLNEEGEIYSLGYNDNFGLLGNKNISSSSSVISPVLVDSIVKYTKVSAGKNHVLALDENGKVYSWGNNAYGQLGHDDTTIRTVPTMIKTFDETKSFNFNAFSNEVFTDSFYQYGGSEYSVVEDGSKGTFIIDKDSGEFTYTPNTNEYSEDTAVISISYNGVAVNYQVNIYIDRKPVFTGGTPSFNVECGLTYTGVAPATDPDNHNLMYSIIKQPLKGEVVLNNNAGSFTYTASNELAGNDTFIIGVSDGYCTVEYPVNVHIQSLISYDDETTINLDLLNINSYSSNINAKDIDGDTLSYSISKLPVKGNVVIDNEGNYTYTANGIEYGIDTFTIKIYDGYKPLEVEYTVNLYAVNDGGTTLAKTITQGVTYSDVIKTDANGVIPTYSIKTQPANGTIVIDLNTGEYTYTPNIGSVGEDSFVVLVDYTYGQYELTIKIYQNTVPNDSNVILNITTNESTNYIGSVECADIDGDVLTYSLNIKPSKGSVSLNPTTGEYTYYPNKNVAGNDSFEVLVSDETDSIAVSISVHIESEIEVTDIINKTISQNTSLSSKVMASDKDGDYLTYSIKTAAINGISNIDSNTGEYIYIPFNNYYGMDSFVIEVTDGVVAKIVTVNVVVNRRPVTDKISIDLETKNITVTGIATCEDPDGDTLLYTIDTQPSMGNVIINSTNGAFAYTPNVDAAGDDTFTIKVSDGCDNIVITVTVHNETELSIDISNTNVVVNQGKSTLGQIDAVDLDGDTLIYSIVNYPTQGTINLNEHSGVWTYNALRTAKGTDVFVINVTDGNISKTVTYNLTINTPAEFTNGTITSLTTNLNANFIGKVEATDDDGDKLTYSVVSQGNKGALSIDPTSGRYLYIPNDDEAGNDVFIIGVSDGNFVTEVEIEIHIESDIEVENSIINANVDKGEITTGNIIATDNDGDLLNYTISQQGYKGTAIVTNDGNWSYFAGEGAGKDSFVIVISDDVHTKYVTVYIHISTKPIFEESNITINVSEGSSTSGQVHGSDEDGDALVYSLASQPQHGTVNLNSQTGEYTYTVFSNNNVSVDTFSVVVTDGKNSAYVEVTVVINNAPDTSDLSVNVNQGGSCNGKIQTNDPENDTLTYSIGIQGAKGIATINSETGEFEYTLTQIDYVGTDTFTVNVSDGYNTKEVLVIVTIIKNETPSTTDLSINVNQGGSCGGKIQATDLENDVLTYSIGIQGTKGIAAISSETGEFEYTLSQIDRVGTDTFTVNISDGYNTKEVLVTVTIIKNEIPDATNMNIVVNQDGSTKEIISATDLEEDILTFSINQIPNKGTVTINSQTGEYEYKTTDKTYYGKDSFKVLIDDGYNKQEVIVFVEITKNSKPTASEVKLNLESDSIATGKIEGKDIEGDNVSYSITAQGVKGNAVIDEQTGELTYYSYKDTKGYDCIVVTLNDGYNEVSYLVQVNIEFVDSNNSWAIPTIIIMGIISLFSTGAFIFLLKKKK